MSTTKSKNKFRGAAYTTCMAAALLAGAVPIASIAWIDPYGVVGSAPKDKKSNELAEKAHYPLWKLARYEKGKHQTIILGDSRARALRDKYWHELGETSALNLAYGGGTIPEIYDTFKLIKDDPEIKNLVVGIQLRSFDEDHKKGMNRVPEAIRLLRNRWLYLTNWSVAKTTFKVLDHQNPDLMRAVDRIASFASPAIAADLGKVGETSLNKLLSPEVCFGCDVPASRSSTPLPTFAGHYNRWRGYYGYHRGGNFTYEDTYIKHYAFEVSAEALTGKFARQVNQNAKSDWTGFEFSNSYLLMLATIGDWAKQNDKNLVFVIPPTIVDMQKTIDANGLSILNHHMRAKLSEFGKVVDLDFPSDLTRDLTKFSDAYHFNSKVARMMAGEVLAFLTREPTIWTQIKRRRGLLRCPSNENEKKNIAVSETLTLTSGKACRLWSAK